MKQHKIGPGIAFGVALGVAAPGLAQQAVQWRVEDGGNGHWYSAQVLPAVISWEGARSKSIAAGGDLATIVTQQEGAFLAAAFSATMGYPSCQSFIGGVRVNGTWTWITGEQGSFWPWNCGQCHASCQPDNSCENYATVMCTSSGNVWLNNFGPCMGAGERGFVMEWSADCNGDGIVDYGQILDGTLEDNNSNGVPDCCDAGQSCIRCPGDITGGGVVDAIDLAAVLGAWGTTGKGKFDADVNDDGTVDASDLAIVLSGWGPCPN